MIMLPEDPAEDTLHDLVERFFGPESPLREAHRYGGREYEERPQQRAMALAIADAFMAGEHLCVEAPTGVGKSFAYLIPALFHAKRTGRPVVITTHTIALQEQLLLKDIPLLQQLLDIPFAAALAKGRDNYLCLHRLEHVLRQHQDYLPMPELVTEVNRLAEWAQHTTDGTRSDLPFVPAAATWAAVCSEPGTCPIETGDEAGKCFLAQARRRLFSADLIVANHALFSVDLALRRDSDGQQSLLPAYSAVVIDEAHTFEEVAATHLGLRVSTYAINLLFDRLYRPRSERGLLHRDEAADARQLLLQTRDVTDRFFLHLRDWVEGQRENPLAYTTPGHIPNPLDEPWNRLVTALRQLAQDDELESDYRQELKSVANRLEDLREAIGNFLSMAQPGFVYWFELYGKQSRHVSLNAVPIEVHPILATALFSQDFPVVLTSATLAIKQELGYFLQRVGAPAARPLILDSPFDFANQVELYLPYHSMPSPKDQAQFLAAVCEQLPHFLQLSGGKAFVLFTNNAFMQEVADRLADFFRDNKLLLLVQGRDLNRTQMLDVFRRDISSVIFGLDSFWMGVDVPGEALSNVIIVKLPFPVPTHPLVAARQRRLEEEGRSAFAHYLLPEAILKFRQGVGRLIRTRTDSGIIVVLDNRILRAGYGKAFLDSLPECRRHVF